MDGAADIQQIEAIRAATSLTQDLPTTDDMDDPEGESEDDEDIEEPLDEDADDFDQEEEMEGFEGTDTETGLPDGTTPIILFPSFKS